MLSVYLDGELPSPWKEKLESHVSDCPLCAERIKAYRSISLKTSGGEEASVNAAGERVWKRLNSSMGRFPRRRAIWRRSVSLPIPAAALLIVGLAFAFLLVGSPDTETGITLASDAGLDVPVQDIESVIEYLIGRSGSEMLILRLPDSQSFVSNGEPAVVLAADYSRQIASWNMQGRRRN